MKSKVAILSLVLLFLTLTALSSIAVEEPEDKSALKISPIKVTLPDGLYFYQPYYGDYTFSPLFIVEKGRLVDPYPLAHRMGLRKFEERYVKDREFNVYVAGEKVGELGSVVLSLDEYGRVRDEHTSINAKGKYSGSLLPGVVRDDSLYIVEAGYEPAFGTLKAVATPKAHDASRKRVRYKATESEIKAAIAAAARDLSEAGKAEAAAVIAKGGGKVTNDHDPGARYFHAVDLDGNGKKDFIGEFQQAYKIEGDDPSNWYYPVDMTFVVWDSGKVEKLLSKAGTIPALSIGGLIDVDGDGTYEVIMIRCDDVYFTSDDEEETDYNVEFGKRVVLLKHGRSGFESVYGTIRLRTNFWLTGDFDEFLRRMKEQ